MKKILIYMLFVLLIFSFGCKVNEQPNSDIINSNNNNSENNNQNNNNNNQENNQNNNQNNNNPVISYELIYEEDGYDVMLFDINDIKIKINDGGEDIYVSVKESMLAKVYDFSEPGIYNLTITYGNYTGKATIMLFDYGTPPKPNQGEGDELPYKGITDEYSAFSGARLAERCELADIPKQLYIGNTYGLNANLTYISSDENVIRINDNNVMICLKAGSATITSNSDSSATFKVTEMTLDAQTYYSTIGYLPEMNSEDIKTILHNLIDEHVSGSYSLLKTILPKSDADPDNSSNMILLYTGRSQGGPITSNNGADDWNREHVWPLSKLGGDSSLTAGHDAHHIRPADVSVNAARGNLEFGKADKVVTDTYAAGSSYCYISSSYFEPRDEVKGDIARMLFYMAVRYEGDVDGEYDLELVFAAHASGKYEIGNLAVLLEWNELDPVDDFERNRNNVIYSYQKNRNPFIDYPNLANLIWQQN